MTASPAVPVAFVLPDLEGGGAQHVMLLLAGALDPSRFSVEVVVVGRADTMASDLPSGMVVTRLGARRLRDGMPRLIAHLRRRRPRVIVSVMGYLNLALLAARPLLRTESRIVVREANVVSATAARLPRWVPATVLYRTLYPRADAIVAPTQLIADEIRQAAPAAGGCLMVLPNPVSEGRLRTAAGSGTREPGEGLRLVAAGRLTEQKGFDRLIELMPTLPPDTHLTIFGEGMDRASLAARISELGLGNRVRLPGFSSGLPAAIAGADLFLLPSRWEGLPNVVLESLAVGTPVIASPESRGEDVARAAPANAVTIAPVGDAFMTAIRTRAELRVERSLRPSLLPAEYRLPAVADRFGELLGRVAAEQRHTN